MTDPFDPRTWVDEPKVIWLDPQENIFVLVDAVDHAWAVQYTWGILWDRHGRKPYAVRWTTVGSRIDGTRKTVKYFMHKEIVKRMGKPPTKKHTMGDHRNGDSTICTRENLRWATPEGNRQNINGSHSGVEHD